MSSNTDLEVSVVMPCLNEAKTVVGCIEEALAGLEAAGVPGEVVVADNGSQDDSVKLAEEAGARVVHVTEKGYGSALMGGIRAAHGKYVVMADCDGSYDFGTIPRFREALRAGPALVMGCRLPRGGGTILPGAMPWKHRWIGNPVLSTLGRILFKSAADDFHCGLRAFDRESVLGLGLRCTGMEFASEMVVKATLARLDVAQIPVTLRPDRRDRRPHLRSWRDGWRHLRFMLLYSPRWLFLYPGLLFFLIGAIAFFALLPDAVVIGAVRFDTNTLLVASMLMVVGLQVMIFAVIARTYAAVAGLLPPTKSVARIMSGQPFEHGLLGGSALILLGLGILVYALWQWREVGFGNLSYPDSLRYIVPSVTAICMGAQIIFGGFILAVLGLEKKA